METKYILHGGYTREANEQNESFFKEIAESVPSKGTVLLVYFASEDKENKFEEDMEKISKFLQGKEVTFLYAHEDEFIEQVRSAHVVYLRGGNTEKLKRQLETYPLTEEFLTGKTVAGSSAGAYVLAKYYFSNSRNKVEEGFGFLNARVVCHYESKIHPSAQGVDPIVCINEYNTNLELIVLRDYEWKVILV